MTGTRLIRAVAVVVIVISFSGCTSSCARLLGVNSGHAAEIRELVSRELTVGDSEDEVEAFLQRHGFNYSYDRLTNRYRVMVRDASPNAVIEHNIKIFIELDEEKRYLGAEVVSSSGF